MAEMGLIDNDSDRAVIISVQYFLQKKGQLLKCNIEFRFITRPGLNYMLDGQGWVPAS